MKKIILFFITLSIIALAAIFTITQTSSSKNDSLLMENVAALAGEDVFLYSVSMTCFQSIDGTPWVTYDLGACRDMCGTHIGVTYCQGTY